MFVSAASTLLCVVAPQLIYQQYADIKTGYFVMAIIFGLIFALPWLLVFRVKEPPAFSATVNTTSENIFKPMLKTFRVRSFRKLLYMYLGFFITMDLITMIMMYFMTDVLSRPDEFSYILGALVISEVIFLPLATVVTNRVGKLKVIIWGYAGWIITCLAMLLLDKGQPGLYAYLLACLTGATISFPLVGIISLFGDVTDVGELYYGTRMEGAFFGVQQLTRKTASAIANFVALAVLGFSGYVKPPEGVISVPQGAGVLLCIRLIMALVPFILLLPSSLVAFTWKLTPKRHAFMINYLDNKRMGLLPSEEDQMQVIELQQLL
jgi:oligogalacturonide transporter